MKRNLFHFVCMIICTLCAAVLCGLLAHLGEVYASIIFGVMAIMCGALSAYCYHDYKEGE